MEQHKTRDSDGDLEKYLVPSKCATPTSQNSLSNIDQMVWVKDGAVYKLICCIAGINKVWQLVYNTTTTPATPYYEFHASNPIVGAEKGLGGLIQTDTAHTFYSWDFEGFNINKFTVATGGSGSTTTTPFEVTLEKTYSISVDDIPDGGWIASVAAGKADTDAMYVLFTRAGGLQEEDTIVCAIDISAESPDLKSSATNSLKVLYKMPSYVTATAYESYAYKKKKILWVSYKVDVNPTGPIDWYWTKDSTAKLVPYRDGDFADITHYTEYGFVNDVCWINTAAQPCAMDIGEGGLVVTDHVDSANIDCVWFCARPLGETKWLKYSGAWKEAKQWPNMWFDSSSDGEWTQKVENQIIEEKNVLIGVCPQNIATTGGAPTFADIQEFEMKQIAATGPDVAKAWDDSLGYMVGVEVGDFPAEIDNTAGSYYSTSKNTTANAHNLATGHTLSLNSTVSDKLIKIRNITQSSEWINIKSKLQAFDTGISASIDALKTKLNSLKINHMVWIPPRQDVNGNTQNGYYQATSSDAIIKFGSPFASGQALNTYSATRTAYENLNTQLQVLKGYADAQTIAVIDPAQITHVTLDEAGGFPITQAYIQMQSYTDSGTKFLVSTLADGGIPQHAEATLTTSGATPLQKLGNTAFEWVNRHNVAAETGNGRFTTPILDPETGENQDATEFWGLFKPTGSAYSILDENTGDDGDAASGLLQATYTGDLLLKNYKFDSSGTTANKFNSGDLTVGIKADESSSTTFATPYGNVSSAATHADGAKTKITFTQGAGADLVSGQTITISSTTKYDGAIVISDVDIDALTFVIPTAFDSDQSGTWTGEIDETNTNVPFLMNETYLYNMSLLYDGYQEGPLMATPVSVGPLVGNYVALHIDVKLNNTNPRVTHIQVYRKKNVAEKFRLVKSVPFNNDWTENIAGTSDMKSTLDFGFKDYGYTGIAYDALTGMPETLQSTSFDTYAESETIGNYLFVANATHPKLDDAAKMIFRSQPGKFSMFNWAQDFIGMPEKIHTLKAHNNRLYAWSKKAMYRLDPYQMIIEQEYPGMGLAGKQSCVSIDGLMYIGNRNGIYQFNAGKFAKINQLIDDRYDALWKEYPTQKVILAMDKRYNALLVMFDNAGPKSIDYAPNEAFSYSLDKRRWDIWEMPRKIKSTCINENNELMICAEASNVVGYNTDGDSLDSDDAIVTNAYSLYEMHKGTDKLALSWTSKALVFGEDARDKKIRTIRLIGRDILLDSMIIDGTERYFTETVDGDTQLIAPTNTGGDDTSDSYFQEWRLSKLVSPHDGSRLNWQQDYTKRVKNIAIKVRSITGTGEALEPTLSSISVTWAPKSYK